MNVRMRVLVRAVFVRVKVKFAALYKLSDNIEPEKRQHDTDTKF